MSTDPESGDAVEANTEGSTPEADTDLRWQECLADALQYFHEQIDLPIEDHTEDGDNPDRAETAREYFNNRGWSDDTIEDRLLGWAPPGEKNSLEAHLAMQGYTRQEMLATGLFTEDLKPLWHGRYVIPYPDRDGQLTYAISRCTGNKGGGKAGYDGHPEDFLSGKYGKLAHTEEYARVSEPIFGQRSIREGEPVIITEGIADAISVQIAGHACISPVTIRFRQRDRKKLLSLLDEYDVPEVYVLQDAERPSASQNDDEELEIQQFGEGIKGAIDTATFLADNDVDARVNTPPRLGCRKADVDDYLQKNWGPLNALLRSAKPPHQHPAYNDAGQPTRTSPSSLQEGSPVPSDTDNRSGLSTLEIVDVTGLQQGYRGPNPLGHTGDSENYFVVNEEYAYDHKRKVAYNALTYLLCDAGERPVNDPRGSFSNQEKFIAWKHAKENGILPADDQIPHGALIHIAIEHSFCQETDIKDGWRMPLKAYNRRLMLCVKSTGWNRVVRPTIPRAQ